MMRKPGENKFIVDMKSVSFAYPGNRPYVVGWGHGSGFGALDEEEALREAERRLPYELTRYAAGVCIEIARICPLCRCDGRKPGCVKKKCPTCKGYGTLDRFGFVVLKPGVSVDGNDETTALRGIRETLSPSLQARWRS